MKPSKYRNVATVIDGIRFASRKEGRRWSQLVLLEKAGKISCLARQVRYPLKVNDQLVTTYVADFTYVEDGKMITEDSKGVETDAFKIKRKLLRAVHGIEILVT